MLIIKNPSTRKIIYWIFNTISPSTNAQVLITYLLAQKSQLCKSNRTLAQELFNKILSIGDDTIGFNILILVLHIVFLFLLLILIDTGFFQSIFSFSRQFNFDESILDDDVSAERQRILALETTVADDDEQNDHLIVNNLVKYYPKRKVRAVDHLTFGAKRGETFGLLGFNVSEYNNCIKRKK